jgi:hypothetical protein
MPCRRSGWKQQQPSKVGTEMSIVNLPSADFASSLRAMTDDEVFETMRELEKVSEERSVAGNVVDTEISHKLALTEDEITRRHPGQLLQPFLDWKKNRGLTR